MERVPFFFRVTNAIVTTAAYLGQTLLPLRLAPFYPLATKGPPPAQIAVASVILISISALTIVYRRRYPFLLVGWLWYLVMLLPVIGLIQVGDQSGADRYTYLPLIGPTVAVIAWATSVLRQQRSENNGLLNANRPRRRIVISAWVGPMSALTLGLLASWAWWQASFWSDPIRLWVHALQARGENYFVMHDYASALIGVGRGADAKRYLQREIQLKCSAEALADLGGISIDDGNLEEGIAQLRESLRGIPSNARVHSHLADALEKTHKSDEAIAEYRKALDLEPQLYEAKFGLGTALAHQNRFAEALPYFQSLVTHDQTAKIPVERDRKTEDLLGLGNTLLRLGRGPEAVEAFSRAVDLNPRLVEAQYNLGLLFMATNRRSEAAEHLEKAIAADPSYVPAQNGLAAVLASEGKYSAAVVHFRKAVELDPKNVLARANLGRTLSRLGQHAAAIEELKAALQLEPYQPQAAAWLAWSLATAPDEKLRNGKEALLWGEKAVAAIGTRDPAALDALAAAQAELGQFAAAVRSCQQAQQLAKSYGNQSLAAEIEERIELYRVNKPYRSR
jgi:tetratricopeptide (TPR) repeat protein